MQAPPQSADRTRAYRIVPSAVQRINGKPLPSGRLRRGRILPLPITNKPADIRVNTSTHRLPDVEITRIGAPTVLHTGVHHLRSIGHAVGRFSAPITSHR